MIKINLLPVKAAKRREQGQRQLLIGGAWVETGDWLEVRSPYDGSLVGRVAKGGSSEARSAVDAAQQAMTEAMPAHEQGSALPPGPLYGVSPAFAVPHDLGFRLVERWQFNLVQVIKSVR